MLKINLFKCLRDIHTNVYLYFIIKRKNNMEKLRKLTKKEVNSIINSNKQRVALGLSVKSIYNGLIRHGVTTYREEVLVPCYVVKTADRTMNREQFKKEYRDLRYFLTRYGM